jgi:hypothetical protein
MQPGDSSTHWMLPILDLPVHHGRSAHWTARVLTKDWRARIACAP